MTKTEQLAAVAERLSEDQIDALLSLARSMIEQPFYDGAPPEALASLKRGLEQAERGETLSLDDLSRRVKALCPDRGLARKRPILVEGQLRSEVDELDLCGKRVVVHFSQLARSASRFSG